MSGSLIVLLILLAGLTTLALVMVDVILGAWERLAEVPEVAAVAADRKGQALLAMGAGLAALTLAYLSRTRGLGVLLLALAALMLLAGIGAWAGRPPHGLSRRVPWRLGLWPVAGPVRIGRAVLAGLLLWAATGLTVRLADALVGLPRGQQVRGLLTALQEHLAALSERPPRRLRWGQRLYLGWSRGRLHRWRLAAGRREDSVGVVGPPRSGKTMGLMAPQLLLWGGAAVSTSVKEDVLRATAGRRLELARRHGGGVYLYAPTAREPIAGLHSVHWSPLAGCRDDGIAKLRVDALIDATETGDGIENSGHWKAGAKRLFRAYFLAAAHHPVWPGDFSLIPRWVAGQQYDEPLAILRGLEGVTQAAEQWAAELLSVKETPFRERGSFFSVAADALGSTADPAVMESCMTTELDVERFLLTRSTLYIVSPSEHQRAVAPLIAALIESIITTAYDLDRRGRLPARLLVSLDELPNIAPLPNLSTHVSQGAGQGVNISWSVQSHAQLRDSYGEHTAEAIWSASTAKVVFGGLADDQHLQRISHLVGDREVRTKSTTFVPATVRGAATQGSSTHRTTSTTWRPRLPVSALRELRPGWVVLLYHNRKAYGLRAPIVQHRRLFRRGLLPWVPPPPAPVDEEQQPHPEPAPSPLVGEGQAEPAPTALPRPAEEAEG